METLAPQSWYSFSSPQNSTPQRVRGLKAGGCLRRCKLLVPLSSIAGRDLQLSAEMKSPAKQDTEGPSVLWPTPPARRVQSILFLRVAQAHISPSWRYAVPLGAPGRGCHSDPFISHLSALYLSYRLRRETKATRTLTWLVYLYRAAQWTFSFISHLEGRSYRKAN